MTPDSSVSLEDYAKRCVETGSKVLSSVEHGWQGLYYETYDLAKKYDLKFIFGTEAYWVKDRHEKDDTNAHIIILAKNETGRRAINSILSEANETGYYYKPRVDLDLLLSLPSRDVFLTSACIGFWKYEDTVDTILKLHNYFKDNFMLECQYHDTESQKLVNAKILELSITNKINMIMGCDSHFIYPNQADDRQYFLNSKKIFYNDEDNWYMDFPDESEAYNRFIKQGIFNKQQIKEIMDNTNILLEFDDIKFNDDIKLPSIYPNKTQEEKDQIFKQIIKHEWDKIKHTIPKNELKEYINAITFEVNTIINTRVSDYFLLDYYLVKKGIENGGIITPSGRGSAVCYYINKLLGFTNVDRVSAKIQMYPERFISEARILESKAMPDLDLNLGNPEVFAKAQEELLGEGHSYPMIAFGKLKEKSAFKMYARVSDIEPDIANEVSKQIEKYEEELKHTEEDEKDTVDIYEFVDEKYHKVLKESEKYRGIISDKKAHACGYLIYNGDIKSEIGLIRCKSESTGKDTITTVIDGSTADKYRFLKNDLLKVDVIKINYEVYKKIGIKPLSVDELFKATDNDKKTWDVYHKGLTMCINQVEKEGTRNKVMRYLPTNIIELSYFVAAIRPGFKSMYHIFESRKPFDYNIKVLDKLIQTKEMPYSFICFQEQVMRVLNYVGIPIDESYNIIKAISKKKKEVILQAKERVISGFYNRVHEEEPELTKEEIEQKSNQIWSIIESCISYLFNSPHAYCVSIDSLTGAYLKGNYTYEFYETVLQLYTEKKNKHKLNKIKKEMYEGYGISTGKIKFELDNRKFKAYKNEQFITGALSSIKYLNKKISEELYKLSKNKYNNFLDLLIDIHQNTSVNNRQLLILTSLNYFSDYGNNQKILEYIKLFEEYYNMKQLNKNKLPENLPEIIKYFDKETEKTYKDFRGYDFLLYLWDTIPNEKQNIIQQLIDEKENLGYCETKLPQVNHLLVIVQSVDTKYTPKLQMYHLDTGEEITYKIYKKEFKKLPLEENDLIYIQKKEVKNKSKMVDGEWVKQEETELWIKEYYKVSLEKFNNYLKTLETTE